VGDSGGLVGSALRFDDAGAPSGGVTVAVSLGSEGRKALVGRADVGQDACGEGRVVAAEEEVEVEVEVEEVVGEQRSDGHRVYTSPPVHQHQLVPLDVDALDDPLDVILAYCLDTVLSDEGRKHENWEERVRVMDTLTRLVLGGGGRVPFFLREMNASHQILETQLNDRRSAVSKQACLLVAVLVQYCGLAVKNVALSLQPSLLKLQGVSIAVMSQSAHDCLDYVYEYCHDGRLLSHLCSTICVDRNAKLRLGALKQLLRVVECWEKGLIEQYRVDIEQTMMAAVVDASDGVRRGGRQVFEVYCGRFGGSKDSWAGHLVDGIERGIWSKVDGGTKKALVGTFMGLLREGTEQGAAGARSKKLAMTPRRIFSGRSSGAAVEGPKRVLPSAGSGRGRAGQGIEDPGTESATATAAMAGMPRTSKADRQSIRSTRMSMGMGALRVAAGPQSAAKGQKPARRSAAPNVASNTLNNSSATQSVSLLVRNLYTPGRLWSDKVDILRQLQCAFSEDQIHEHISNESFDMLSDALVAEVGDAHYRVACQAMDTLSAGFGCATIAQHMQHHMEQIVPVLFVRIGDSKECVRTAASEALLVVKEKNDLDLVLQGMVAATRTCKATKAQCAIMMYFEDVFDVHRGSSGNSWRTMLAYCLRMATNKNPDVREHAIAACARVYHSGKMAAVEAALSGLPMSPRTNIKTALDAYGWDAAAQSKSQSRLLSDALHYSEDDTDALLDEDENTGEFESQMALGRVHHTVDDAPVLDSRINATNTTNTTNTTKQTVSNTSSNSDDGSVSFGDVCVESPNHPEYEGALDDLEVCNRADGDEISLQPRDANTSRVDEVVMMLSAPPNELFVRLASIEGHTAAALSPDQRAALGSAVWDAFCSVILSSSSGGRNPSADDTPGIAACGAIISFFGFVPKERIEEKIDMVLCTLLDIADGDDYELSTVAIAAGIQLVKAADSADAYSCLAPLLPSPSGMPPFRGPEARRLTNILKLLRPCLRQIPQDQLKVALHLSLPSLCRCFESPHAEIRHLCLDCIVTVMTVVGEGAVSPFTSTMTKTQQQLIALHFAKATPST
jgi:hypothetical protein